MAAHGKYSEPQSQSAPLGVKIIAVLGIIGGLLGLVASFGFTAIGGTSGVVLALLFGAFSVGMVVVNAALLSLEQWAWKAAIALNALAALLDLLRAEILGAIISVVVIAYLLTKREYFQE